MSLAGSPRCREERMQNLHHFRSAVTMILFLLLASSCMLHRKYPAEWSPLIPTENEECPDISGTFVNQGEDVDKRTRYFSDAFGKTEMYKSTARRKIEATVTHVRIVRPDEDKLEISFWNDSSLVDKNIYSRDKGQYICTAEGIRIPLGSALYSQMGEGIVPVGVGWLTLYLTKNLDGDLIVKYASSGIGLALIVPVAGSSSGYARFRQER